MLKSLPLQITLIIILLCSAANPQFKVRMQGVSAMPLGFAEDAVSVGFGGNLNISYFVFSSNIEVSFTGAYHHFGLKENLPDYDFSFRSIPILAGIRYNFIDYNFIPYIGLEGGIFISNYYLEIDYGFFGKEQKETDDIHWGISPEIGFRMNISSAFDVETTAKYYRINTKYIARAYLCIQTGFTLRI